MYNARPVLAGIAIVVILFSAPFWTGRLGRDYKDTGVVPPENEKSCIEDTGLMRSRHMQLLNEWRDEALRGENRSYTAADGKTWAVSLRNTCLSCHANYREFCERCHEANSVYPYCWTCHVLSVENRK
ncbi:MAG: sulfate reduction electron transfer complex DsrMKJOP subunit DsrJ [Desulfovibrio sp.]|jgi:hypothetical protein|nr:sulfate reduction electron transfer complex DsrMKJOP subunit DsrJ [Desulfovibrio sp.]